MMSIFTTQIFKMSVNQNAHKDIHTNEETNHQVEK